jgi:pimeloyl-ACP methyl ester carboxylesterase
MEDLRDVTLVGWSYAGAVTTGTLDRVADRIQSMIYLDAFVPANGKAIVDYDPHARRQVETAMARDEPIPPPPLKYLGVIDANVIGLIEPRWSAQPWRTLQQPLQLTGPLPHIPLTYVVCTSYGATPFTERLAEMQARADVRTAAITSDHFCMLSAPDETVRVLTSS